MNFSFPDLWVRGEKLLEGGNFSLPEKGLFCLCGKNGSGKTLLLNYFFEQKRKEGISALLMDQSNQQLLEKEDLRHNLAFSSQIDPEQEGVFLRYGIEHLLKHKSHELSGGEKRLICLLRLIETPAALLLMDEPGNDLDIDRMELLISLLKEQKEKRLLLVITHDDRLLALADGVLRIWNHQLESDAIAVKTQEAPEPVSEEASDDSQRETQRVDYSFLKRQFGFDWVAAGISLAFIIAVWLLGAGLLQEGEKMNDLIPENRIDIIHPLSVYYERMKAGSFPIIYGAYLHGEISTESFAQILQAYEKNAPYIAYSLSLPPEGSYEYRPVEYYNRESREYYYPRLSEEAISLLSDLPGGRVGSGQEQWQDLEQDPDVSLMYVSLFLEPGMDMKDFLGSDALRRLWGEPLYIRTQEIIALRNAAMTSHLRKITFSQMSVVTLSCLVLESTLAALFSFLIRQRIRIFRNMAYPRNIIQKAALKRMAFGKVYLAGFLLLLFGMAAEILLITGAERIIVNYLLCVLPTLLYFPLIYGIKYVVFTQTIRKTTNWRYR